MLTELGRDLFQWGASDARMSRCSLDCGLCLRPSWSQAGGQISSNRRDQPKSLAERSWAINHLLFACLSVGLDSPRSPPGVSPNQGGILLAPSIHPTRLAATSHN